MKNLYVQRQVVSSLYEGLIKIKNEMCSYRNLVEKVTLTFFGSNNAFLYKIIESFKI